MNKLEVFFDYACPYCFRGHQNLIDLLPDFPELEIAWRPCESHPRPDRYGMHSDLLIQGMYFAADKGVDIWQYHEAAYSLILIQQLDVENINIVAQGLKDILDAGALAKSLENGEYSQALQDGNHLAFEKSGVWAVPSYRMNGRKLDAVENVGVTKDQLRAFIAGL